MSVKLMLFVRRRADLTHEQFKARYESGHAPLARRSLPLLRGYVRNFLAPIPGGSEPPYDCVTEFWFDNADDFRATMVWAGSAEGQGILAADEAEFMDRSSMVTFLAEEHALPRETLP